MFSHRGPAPRIELGTQKVFSEYFLNEKNKGAKEETVLIRPEKELNIAQSS